MLERRDPGRTKHPTGIPPELGDDVVPFERVLGASSIKRLFCLEPSSVPQPDDQPAEKALGKRAGRGDRVAHSRGQRQESLVFNPLVGKGLDPYLVVDERNRHGIRQAELGFIGRTGAPFRGQGLANDGHLRGRNQTLDGIDCLRRDSVLASQTRCAVHEGVVVSGSTDRA